MSSLWVLVFVIVWADPSERRVESEYGPYPTEELCWANAESIGNTFLRGRAPRPTSITPDCRSREYSFPPSSPSRR